MYKLTYIGQKISRVKEIQHGMVSMTDFVQWLVGCRLVLGRRQVWKGAFMDVIGF